MRLALKVAGSVMRLAACLSSRQYNCEFDCKADGTSYTIRPARSEDVFKAEIPRPKHRADLRNFAPQLMTVPRMG